MAEPLVTRLPNAPGPGLEEELANARRLLEAKRHETGWEVCSIEPRDKLEQGRYSFVICWPTGDEAALSDLVCDVFMGAVARMAPGDENRLESIAAELEALSKRLPGEGEAVAAVQRLVTRAANDARRLARDLHDIPALVEVLERQANA